VSLQALLVQRDPPAARTMALPTSTALPTLSAQPAAAAAPRARRTTAASRSRLWFAGRLTSDSCSSSSRQGRRWQLARRSSRTESNILRCKASADEGEKSSMSSKEEELLMADMARFAREKQIDDVVKEAGRVQQEESETLVRLKESIENGLQYTFLIMMFALAWFVLSIILNAVGIPRSIELWLLLWPTFFQPALGIHMLGCIVVGAIGYFKNDDDDDGF